MIEAVTTRGYEKTSVRLVIGLAGVSRRAFYEQFSDKEDCFMATFDLIVNRAIKRLTDAYRSAEGDLQQGMRMALEALGGELEQNSKALRLVLIDAQTVGPEGLRRLHRTTAVCEGLLVQLPSLATGAVRPRRAAAAGGAGDRGRAATDDAHAPARRRDRGSRGARARRC